MTNPTLEFLNEIKGKRVLITVPFQGLKIGCKVEFAKYKIESQNIILTFIHKKKEIKYSISWQDNLPFTHFVSSKDAYFHARRVKKRFNQEIENVVFSRSPKLLFLYAIAFIKERFPKNLENIVVQNPYYAYKYAKNFLDHRLEPEQEEVFLKDKRGESLAYYAIEIVKERLPDKLHNFLILKSMEHSNNKWISNLFRQYFAKYSPENVSETPQEPAEAKPSVKNNGNWAVSSYTKSYNINSVFYNTANPCPNKVIDTSTNNFITYQTNIKNKNKK